MDITHTPISNGAVVSRYAAEQPGQHTLIVAGQHGNETGPIDALAGFHPKVLRGTVTLIRCANPWGYAVGSRRYPSPSESNRTWDMNRGWGTDPLNLEIWTAVTEAAGTPSRVFDLHSARRPWWAGVGRAYRGRECLAMGGGESLAEALALTEMIRAEYGAAWRARVYDHPDGSLAKFAYAEGIRTGGRISDPPVAVTVEFDESIDIEAEVQGEPSQGAPSGPQDLAEDLRRRTRYERTIGVLAAVEAILDPHTRE